MLQYILDFIIAIITVGLPTAMIAIGLIMVLFGSGVPFWGVRLRALPLRLFLLFLGVPALIYGLIMTALLVWLLPSGETLSLFAMNEFVVSVFQIVAIYDFRPILVLGVFLVLVVFGIIQSGYSISAGFTESVIGNNRTAGIQVSNSGFMRRVVVAGRLDGVWRITTEGEAHIPNEDINPQDEGLTWGLDYLFHQHGEYAEITKLRGGFLRVVGRRSGGRGFTNQGMILLGNNFTLEVGRYRLAISLYRICWGWRILLERHTRHLIIARTRNGEFQFMWDNRSNND